MDLAEIPALAEPEGFHVVVECPRGSSVKWKYEPRWRAFFVSRPLSAGLTFPYDWGFIPATCADDGDPLDAMLLWDVPSYPGVVIPCRAIGVLQVEQNQVNHDRSRRIRNDRVMCVPLAARREHAIADVSELPARLRDELEHFAIAATALEGKDVRILDWGDAKSAWDLVRRSAAARNGS